MNDKTKDRVWTGLTVIIVLLVVAGGLFYSMPWFRRYFLLRQQNAERDERLHEIACRKAEIDDQVRRFKTDEEFVLSIAREKRLYHPREYVIIFGDQEKRK